MIDWQKIMKLYLRHISRTNNAFYVFYKFSENNNNNNNNPMNNLQMIENNEFDEAIKNGKLFNDQLDCIKKQSLTYLKNLQIN